MRKYIVLAFAWLFTVATAFGNPALWPAWLPAENMGWWKPHTELTEPGVGVPGGFVRFTAGQSEDRAVTGNVINVVTSYSADNTGASDATTAINSAIAASASGDVIYLPAGTYRIDGNITADRTRWNRTLRGAGDSTILVNNGSPNDTVGEFGFANSWLDSGPVQQAVSGTKTKGVTTLSVTNASSFTVGGFAVISVENEHDNTRITAGAPPTFSSAYADNLRTWPVRVTGRDTTANTVSFDPPLLIDLTDYATTLAPGDYNGWELQYFGVEDMRVMNGSGSPFWRGFRFGRAAYCWLYNVTFDGYSEISSTGGCVFWYVGYRNEVRNNRFIHAASGQSDGGIQLSEQTSILIENNSFTTTNATNGLGWDVAIYNDGNSNNGVYAFNFFEQDHKNISLNHSGGHSLVNLYEGNLGQRVQADGYHTSTSHHTIFRNWFSGRNASGETHPQGGYTSWFKRFTRKLVVLGNVWGWDGLTSSGDKRPQWGYPYIGSDAFTGYVQPTAGTFWADWPNYLAETYTQVQLILGFYEIDLDVELSSTIISNYESETPTGGLTDSTVETLPASLFRDSKPDWFGSIAWPAVNPISPDFDYTRIPQGYIFVNGNEDYLGESGGGTATVNTLNVTGSLNIAAP